MRLHHRHLQLGVECGDRRETFVFIKFILRNIAHGHCDAPLCYGSVTCVTVTHGVVQCMRMHMWDQGISRSAVAPDQ